MDIKEVKMKISPISSTLSKPNFKGQFAYNYNESTLKNNKLWQKIQVLNKLWELIM